MCVCDILDMKYECVCMCVSVRELNIHVSSTYLVVLIMIS